MKVYTKEELAEILRKHILWLKNEEDGEQANLRSADLSSADLRSADLSYADLRYANLSSADLRSADLSSANLRSADLSYADLRSANLRSADLSSADLSYANKREINTIVSIAGIGSARRMTTYWIEEDIVWCGCFRGTLAEFVKKVSAAYGKDEIHGQTYRAAIAFFKSVKKSTEVKP